MKRTKIFCLGSNGGDRVRSMRKIPTRLRGMNFCTSSAHFPPSFVRQPNGPKCTQVVRNAPKRQFRVQCGGTCSARFAPTSVRQPNGTKCTQIVRNAPKHQFGSNRVNRVRSLRKIPTQLRGTNFCTVRPILHRVSKGNQTVPNAPK